MVTEKQKTKKNETGLSVLGQNEELARMYRENAGLGAENLGGVSPQLKIHAAGRSSTNELADGEEPKDGWFFYRPTGEQFKELECHILTISKGFRVDGIDRKNVFNQLMAGVIVNDRKPRPFIMYLHGLKLSPMWEFGKEVSKYTHAKPVPIPMFALRIKLSTKKVKTDYGFSWVEEFEIVKDEKGSPVIVTDKRVFSYLKIQISVLTEIINAIIEAKSPEEVVTGKPKELPTDEEIEKARLEPKNPESTEEGKEDVSPDDIPF